MNSSAESCEIDYEVERIDGKRLMNGVVQYFIKWKNYPVEDNTWEPIDHLNCPKRIAKYEAELLNGESKRKRPNKPKSGAMKTANDRDQPKMTDFLYNVENMKRIIDMKRSKGEVIYLVEYNDSSEEWVPMEIIKRSHPQKVIEFYEACITWDPTN